ncbi:hypothetical protein IHE50_00850 [Candidatus Parvarchaeota archaeon]|jgi:hypothetical protein|uniref:Transmembrane protein n=1 Tax=Candidatus Acidifodinimicrobium mancum TaxID=2898728 RepID=A0A8T3UTX3_9ARCH|nr:hypothetical protein [Candidatus Acidifodinimicrobium mancum]MBE5729033.1 hypothetical protein [Candidatus Acidifodinimicrobium mancum]MBE5730112.1 hypothetical protein [Candidatus Acidifodinimicrobium mancum]
MNKSEIIIIAIVFILVVGAIIFYSDPSIQHKEVAQGLCELQCQNLTRATGTVSNSCISNDIAYGYGCAVSNSSLKSTCTSKDTIVVNSKCSLLGTT